MNTCTRHSCQIVEQFEQCSILHHVCIIHRAIELRSAKLGTVLSLVWGESLLKSQPFQNREPHSPAPQLEFNCLHDHSKRWSTCCPLRCLVRRIETKTYFKQRPTLQPIIGTSSDATCFFSLAAGCGLQGELTETVKALDSGVEAATAELEQASQAAEQVVKLRLVVRPDAETGGKGPPKKAVGSLKNNPMLLKLQAAKGGAQNKEAATPEQCVPGPLPTVNVTVLVSIKRPVWMDYQDLHHPCLLSND